MLVSVGGHRQLRSDFRVPVDLAARIGETVVKVSDVTLSGAGLVVDSPRPVGSIFALELRLPALEGPRHDLSLRARVRSCSRAPDGTVRMGVEFVRPSPENVERLIEFSRVTMPTGDRGTLEGAGSVSHASPLTRSTSVEASGASEVSDASPKAS